jgi:hypothetical protein
MFASYPVGNGRRKGNAPAQRGQHPICAGASARGGHAYLAGSLPTGVKITPCGVVVKGGLILNNTQTILGEYLILFHIVGMGICGDAKIFYGDLKRPPLVHALVQLPYRVTPSAPFAYCVQTLSLRSPVWLDRRTAHGRGSLAWRVDSTQGQTGIEPVSHSATVSLWLR